MKKDTKIYLILLVLIVIIILGIFIYKSYSKKNYDIEVINCIASKSSIYSSKVCGHCIKQKEILGDYYTLFNVTDCFLEENYQKCNDANIPGTPTWIINNKQYPGIKTIEELKTLTGC
jgi:hypothetical protein